MEVCNFIVLFKKNNLNELNKLKLLEGKRIIELEYPYWWKKWKSIYTDLNYGMQ